MSRDREVDRDDERVGRAHARQQVQGSSGRGADLANAARSERADPLEGRDDLLELLRGDERSEVDANVDEIRRDRLEQAPVPGLANELA